MFSLGAVDCNAYSLSLTLQQYTQIPPKHQPLKRKKERKIKNYHFIQFENWTDGLYLAFELQYIDEIPHREGYRVIAWHGLRVFCTTFTLSKKSKLKILVILTIKQVTVDDNLTYHWGNISYNIELDTSTIQIQFMPSLHFENTTAEFAILPHKKMGNIKGVY